MVHRDIGVDVEHMRRNIFIGTGVQPATAYVLDASQGVHHQKAAITILFISIILLATKITRTSIISMVLHLGICAATAASFPASYLLVRLLALFGCYCALYTLVRRWYVTACLLITAAICHDFAAISVLPFFIYTRLHQCYRAALQPRNSLLRACARLFIITPAWIGLPASAFILSLASTLTASPQHSGMALDYSFGFQAALSGFSAEVFHKTTLDAPRRLAATDLYVMDRSVISLLNTHHRRFVLPPAYPASIGPQALEIHKVHIQGSAESEEESRFIKGGDFVRIVARDTEQALGVLPDSMTHSLQVEEKLKAVAFGVHKDERDMWVVECTGPLTARRMEFQLRSTATGLFLGASVKGKQLGLHASVYSALRTRQFLIADNTNHPFFVDEFADTRTRSQVTEFIAAPFTKRLVEYAEKFWAHRLNRHSENTRMHLCIATMFIVWLVLFLITRYFRPLWLILAFNGRDVYFLERLSVSSTVAALALGTSMFYPLFFFASFWAALIARWTTLSACPASVCLPAGLPSRLPRRFHGQQAPARCARRCVPRK